jgi:hypothetical protein
MNRSQRRKIRGRERERERGVVEAHLMRGEQRSGGVHVPALYEYTTPAFNSSFD